MYVLWELYRDNIDILRLDLKKHYWVLEDKDQEKVVNTILPLMVDALTDEDLRRVLDKVCDSLVD